MMIGLLLGAHTLSSVVSFGANVAPIVQEAVRSYVGKMTVPNGTSVSLGIGALSSMACRELLPQASVDAAGPEGYRIVSSVAAAGVVVICADGNPMAGRNSITEASLGAHFGTFALLELLGVAFLHPLEPLCPPEMGLARARTGLNITSSPRYSWRGFHLHTEHPIEVLELLQGSDAMLPSNVTIPWVSMLPRIQLVRRFLFRPDLMLIGVMPHV